MRIFKKITIEDFLCSHMIGIHIPRLKGYNHYIHKYCILTTVGLKNIAANNVLRVVLFLKMCVGQISIQIFLFFKYYKMNYKKIEPDMMFYIITEIAK